MLDKVLATFDKISEQLETKSNNEQLKALSSYAGNIKERIEKRRGLTDTKFNVFPNDLYTYLNDIEVLVTRFVTTSLEAGNYQGGLAELYHEVMRCTIKLELAFIGYNLFCFYRKEDTETAITLYQLAHGWKLLGMKGQADYYEQKAYHVCKDIYDKSCQLALQLTPLDAISLFWGCVRALEWAADGGNKVAAQTFIRVLDHKGSTCWQRKDIRKASRYWMLAFDMHQQFNRNKQGTEMIRYPERCVEALEGAAGNGDKVAVQACIKELSDKGSFYQQGNDIERSFRCWKLALNIYQKFSYNNKQGAEMIRSLKAIKLLNDAACAQLRYVANVANDNCQRYLKSAESLFMRAIGLIQPAPSSSSRQSARIYFNLGLFICVNRLQACIHHRHAEAIPYLEKAIALSADNDIALNFREADKCIVTSELKTAIDDYGKITVSLHILALFLLVQAQRCYRLEEPSQQTLASLQQAVEKQPQALHYCLLAFAYKELGKTEEAKRCFEKAMELQLNYGLAQQGLAADKKKVKALLSLSILTENHLSTSDRIVISNSQESITDHSVELPTVCH